ncbi:MAG: class IV adenylate cyclase [Planctomycetaceae bacterium]
METEVDLYLAHPSRDFARTDEAFRIRTVGESNCLTYKGPRIDTVSKTRREIELALPSGAMEAATARAMFASLGFVPAGEVRKERTRFQLEWQGRAFVVVLDKVANLGEYVEVETIAAEHELETARSAALGLAEQLGLSGGERRSYLQLILDRASGAAVE